VNETAHLGKDLCQGSQPRIKKQPTLQNEFEQTLKLLQQDVFGPSLETHKLKGKLAGLWPAVLHTTYELSLTSLRPKVSRKMILGCSKKEPTMKSIR
jgi:mRNA-degrading endonuclease YafQ of YafQ-DinJ toxin-antitoxin module